MSLASLWTALAVCLGASLGALLRWALSAQLNPLHGRWHASLNRPDPLRVLMMPTEVPVDQEAVGMRTASIDRLVFATT